MFNIDYNYLKKAKIEYLINLKNPKSDYYKIHEKNNISLNHSVQSNPTDRLPTKSNTNKTFISNNNNNNICQNKKNLIVPNVRRSIQKCSYLKFLELRKPKNCYPMGNCEKRFKWQNLNDGSNVVYPEIYERPHKRQHLLKETFGEGMLGFLNDKKEFDPIPRIRRMKRSNSEDGTGKDFHMRSIDLSVSRRVILPEFNNEEIKISKKKSNSQSRFLYNRTNGNIKSLFELTPVNVPVIGKKLYKSKSYGGLTINLFDKNYSKYDKPKRTKKIFFGNKCYIDSIKANDIIFNISNCWKKEMQNSVESKIPKNSCDIKKNVKKLDVNIYNNYMKDNRNMTRNRNKGLNKIKRKIQN